MKIKTSELIGPALDWAVAKCEDRRNMVIHNGWVFVDGNPGSPILGLGYCPSADWAQGGPIIEWEMTDIEHLHSPNQWHATHPKNKGGLIRHHGYGPTPLIAAMRCYVASKLGDEIEIPEELK